MTIRRYLSLELGIELKPYDRKEALIAWVQNIGVGMDYNEPHVIQVKLI